MQSIWDEVMKHRLVGLKMNAVFKKAIYIQQTEIKT